MGSRQWERGGEEMTLTPALPRVRGTRKAGWGQERMSGLCFGPLSIGHWPLAVVDPGGW